MPGESKTSPRRIQAVERQKQALQLRMAGATFEAIAIALGYKEKSGAYVAVKAALARIPAPGVEEYRRINLERINTERLGLHQRLSPGEKERIDLEVKLQEREANYLGLDAPTRLWHSGEEGGPIEVDARVIIGQLIQRIAQNLSDEKATLPIDASPDISNTVGDGSRNGNSSQ